MRALLIIVGIGAAILFLMRPPASAPALAPVADTCVPAPAQVAAEPERAVAATAKPAPPATATPAPTTRPAAPSPARRTCAPELLKVIPK